MKFKRKLIIFTILILVYNQLFLYNHLFASRISYYIKPVKIEKGKVFLVIFQNLDAEKEYLLKVSGSEVYKYELTNIDEYTLKLVGVSLNSPGRLRISLLENGKEIMEDWIKVHGVERKVSRVRVKEKYITPPKSSIKRIGNEYLRKKKVKNVIIKERFFWGAPVFPVTNGILGTPFGYNRIYNNRKKSIHYGTDISAPSGTPIKSIFKGEVILTGNLYYTGNTVIIHHGDGLISLYAHINKIAVKENQIVEKGEVIGTVGSTGRSTGPHLHLSVYVNRITVDPMSLFEILKE